MLSAAESDAFVRFVQSGTQIRDYRGFDHWCATELRGFMGFGLLAYAAGRREGDVLSLQTLRGLNYADPYMTTLPRHMPLSTRRVVQAWLNTREPQLVRTCQAETELSPDEAQEFRDHMQTNIAAHGWIDPTGTLGSYFSFSRLHEPLDERMQLKLRMAAPYLHQALTEVQCRQDARNRAAECRVTQLGLTPSEMDVLRGMAVGWSNARIASTLGKSALTVKTQVGAVLRKLQADNRAEAAYQAHSLGLLTPWPGMPLSRFAGGGIARMGDAVQEGVPQNRGRG